jgi:hypothetical protein
MDLLEIEISEIIKREYKDAKLFNLNLDISNFTYDDLVSYKFILAEAVTNLIKNNKNADTVPLILFSSCNYETDTTNSFLDKILECKEFKNKYYNFIYKTLKQIFI